MQIIASDLKRTPVDETEFIPGQDYSNCVIQSPTAMDNYVLLYHMYPGIQFLYVKRPKKDIIASMRRIKWCKDDVHNWDQFLEQHLESRIRLWQTIKDQYPYSCSEITFDSFRHHSLFVDDQYRKQFTSRQWQLNQPFGPMYWTNNLECTKQLYGERYPECTTG